MKNISYSSTTYKEYQLNGDAIIRVNVSDIGILTRYRQSAEEIDKVHKRIGSHPTADDLDAADKAIRSLIDGVFGEGISDAAFGAVNCLSPTTDGGVLCINFLRAFFPVVSEDIKAAAQAAKITLDDSKLNNEKTQKYIKPVPMYAGQYVPTAGNTYMEKASKPLTDEQKAFLKELLGE